MEHPLRQKDLGLRLGHGKLPVTSGLRKAYVYHQPLPSTPTITEIVIGNEIDRQTYSSITEIAVSCPRKRH
ncbi:hypothetical protein M0804_006593 [Polistes exclamans]|nr:hypothetical protein M0804_006593 [Polistes exclamans]